MPSRDEQIKDGFKERQQRLDQINHTLQHGDNTVERSQTRIRRNVLLGEATRMRATLKDLNREITAITGEIATFDDEFPFEIAALQRQRSDLLAEAVFLRCEIERKRAEAQLLSGGRHSLAN